MNESNNNRAGDRHISPFMLRLPEVFREKLRILRERTGTPMTQLVKAALKRYFALCGLWGKEDDAREHTSSV
jgi:hypothetical protein